MVNALKSEMGKEKMSEPNLGSVGAKVCPIALPVAQWLWEVVVCAWVCTTLG
jgi:hypothetical protein